MKNTLTILGIDPGFAILGYGCIRGSGSDYSCLTYGCIKTPSYQSFEDRLYLIHKELSLLCEKLQPDLVAVEKLFFSKNTKTALDVAHARGVILLTARLSRISLKEFTPLQVKQGIVGYGRAEKSQIQKTIQLLLHLKELPRPDDAADALALALCAAATYRQDVLLSKK